MLVSNSEALVRTEFETHPGRGQIGILERLDEQFGIEGQVLVAVGSDGRYVCAHLRGLLLVDDGGRVALPWQDEKHRPHDLLDLTRPVTGEKPIVVPLPDENGIQTVLIHLLAQTLVAAIDLSLSYRHLGSSKFFTGQG